MFGLCHSKPVIGQKRPEQNNQERNYKMDSVWLRLIYDGNGPLNWSRKPGTFGMQDKDGHLQLGTLGADGTAIFELVLQVKSGKSGEPVLLGSFAHGPPNGRFLYLAQKKGEIRHRNNLEDLLWKFLVPTQKEILFVSTNWDTVIENSIRKILIKHFKIRMNTVHIHGSTENSNRMYLPSELTRETYRKKEDEIWIGQQHGKTWQMLEKCRKVIIYGLSLDPLDAELGMVLAAGLSNPILNEILIVDPNHSTVAHRVNVLLDPRREIKVKGINCITMQEEADYTIRRDQLRRDSVVDFGK